MQGFFTKLPSKLKNEKKKFRIAMNIDSDDIYVFTSH